jgi:P-type conjugative transfer protein TrbJ
MRHHIPLRCAAAAAAATLILASASPPAQAVSEVAGATFPEQIVQEVTAVEQDEQAVMQTEQQIGMLANQAENLGTMPLQFWGQLTAPIMQMQEIIGQAQGISASVQDTAAQTAYDYGDPTGSVGYAGGTLAQWTQGFNSQITGVLHEYGLSRQQFATSAATEQTLQAASRSAQGRNQILQASNAMNGVLVTEIAQLDTDTRTANTAILTDMGNRANARVAKQKVLSGYLTAPLLKSPY